MKNIKMVLLILVFGTLAAGGLFAQDKSIYIRPTLSAGFGYVSVDGGGDDTGLATAFDVDFVNDFGLTLGVQSIIIGNSDGTLTGAPFGAGYTYDADKWCVGGKFMFVPGSFMSSWGAGFDISGTYWFRENLGVTGIVDLYFPEDTTAISVRVGISYKL
jgi:hypothetical protein